MLSHGQVVRLIFGLKLRELRQERGYTPAELARACDVSVSYLNEIEKGKKYPKADKILSLSKVLGVSYDQLTSLTLSRRLEPISELLQSDLLKEFPLDMFGLDPLRIVELIADAPAKMNAFISTLFEIARNYEMRQEHFFLAALRSFQEMHDNYFEELEQDVRTFVVEHKLSAAAPLDRGQLERVLVEKYGYTLDRTGLAEYAHLGRLRSVFQPKNKRLLLRQGLSGAQEGFVLGREVAFNYLNLRERPYVNASFPVRSFEEVLNNFKASYFAGALLMEEEMLVRDLTRFFTAKKWDPTLLLELLAKYDVSPEMFMQRITNLLPRHFGIQSLFFLRFDQANASAGYKLTKELHLSRLHNPHGNELHEHYCRRWISLRMIAELRQQPATTAPNYTLGAQRSRYPNNDEYLCLTVARAGAANEPAVSVTVGLLCDDNLRQKIRFLDDATILQREVNETCERCTIPNCEVRAAAPVEIERRQRQQELEAAVAALVNGA
ncbi:helix-turn-helix domain-containing protein [Hymenobacter sp. HSC-4F20]|uniref:helix-turn-helix domain-containing protein n=1 Tax=Hymenobacter sp. HSC-4F20 TaxID=2864135 RepID=UPI001C73D7D4|nr:helix-turn-helix transcriptional regulator [Hymenobacter sp. HSC-4F20]MBX0290790.1 helix-turn-helix domain-containing protein [Hymenobacter sp. HSC-4F20]